MKDFTADLLWELCADGQELRIARRGQTWTIAREGRVLGAAPSIVGALERAAAV